MADRIERLYGATVQHGRHNDRVYLMKLGRDAAVDPIAGAVEALAAREGYSKIFAKVPEAAAAPFQERGFRSEAQVPGLFGASTGIFLSKFLTRDRERETAPEEVRKILRACRERNPAGQAAPWPPGFDLRPATEEDAEAMAALFREIFPSYPFPIDEPDYLREAMARGLAHYYVVRRQGRVLAASAAEMDRKAGHAEMTDFAVHPSARGHGLALHLLGAMEKDMRQMKIATAFTIARALSFGMNLTFARAGYAFGGTLINNTHICGRLESMNVWHKPLAA